MDDVRSRLPQPEEAVLMPRIARATMYHGPEIRRVFERCGMPFAVRRSYGNKTGVVTLLVDVPVGSPFAHRLVQELQAVLMFAGFAVRHDGRTERGATILRLLSYWGEASARFARRAA